MTTESILDSIKKVLGLDPEYTEFDNDVIMHVNSIFSTLNQLGVGPEDSFSIEDSTSIWDDFIGSAKNISSVKSYVYLKVRLIFDPPATSFAIAAFEKQAAELEWRLNVVMEGANYVAVVPTQRSCEYE
jgi:hypothetical protein